MKSVLTRCVTGLAVTFCVFCSRALQVGLLLQALVGHVGRSPSVLLQLAGGRILPLRVVAESRVRVVALGLRREGFAQLPGCSPGAAVHLPEYLPARRLGEAHVQLWEVFALVLFVEDGLDGERHQGVAPHGHFPLCPSLSLYLQIIKNK